MEATKRQTWALFCASGLDCRGIDLSRDEASGLIDALRNGFREQAIEELQMRGATGEPKVNGATRDREFEELYERAWAAGVEAAAECTPTPMLVQEHANVLDDSSPVVKTYAPVMGGVCGFAGVRIRPATTSFARWLKKNQGWWKSYYGGIENSIHEYNQSMERKAAHAGAMAQVLREAGHNAYAWSRED